MTVRRFRGAAFAFLTLACAATPAAAMSAHDEALVERGMDALYRSDYDGAEKLFKDEMAARPGEPVPSLGYATAAWWRMENDFALPGSDDEKRFSSAIGKAIEDAEASGKSGKKGEADFYLGAAYGLRGRWEASQRHWMRAYFDGRKAYKLEKKALKLEPTLYDADLGVGAFDYYLATLSRVIRALAFTSGGNREKGLAELQLAADYGRFGKVAAKLLIVGIDWTFERKPREAFESIEKLRAEFPDSPFIETMRLIGLYQLRDGPRLEREARLFLKNAEDGARFYLPLDKAMGRYFVGLGEQLDGRYAEALAEYRAALAMLPPVHRARGLLELFIGEALDLQGKRAQAVASYRAALQEPPMWGVPKYAERLIDKPFRSGDDPLPSRGSTLQ